MEIADVKKGIQRILREELQGTSYRAFFFGSRVTGTNGERSDFDVGVEDPGGAVVPQTLLTVIRARCDALPTLYTIDIVDFASVSEEFRTLARVATEEIV